MKKNIKVRDAEIDLAIAIKQNPKKFGFPIEASGWAANNILSQFYWMRSKQQIF